MLYLIAFFLSPLALLLAGKPFQAFLNAILYLLAWLGLLLFAAPGVLLWLIGVAHACLVISGKRADQRTRRIVEAVRARDRA